MIDALEVAVTKNTQLEASTVSETRDKAWLRALMTRHGGVLAGYFATRLGDRALAEELVIEVFFRAWSCRHSLEVEEAVRGWLWTIAKRVLAAHFKRQSRRPDVVVMEAPPERPSLETRTDERSVKRKALRECLGALNERVQRSAELVWLLGHSYVEAAELLGDTPDSVRMRLKRARGPLQSCLARKGVLG